ncbi:MAG: hypothetical protein GWN00_06720 [Aliifodinibius sp.]|nr:hypothetical protein [Fodinibius sp.]NIY24510.1 hypothetical protein [Fodinibius sp.]
MRPKNMYIDYDEQFCPLHYFMPIAAYGNLASGKAAHLANQIDKQFSGA